MVAVRSVVLLATLALASSCKSNQTSSGESAKGEKVAKPKRGIVGQLAPKWNIGQWWNLAQGSQLEVDALRGKVVFLMFFQSW